MTPLYIGLRKGNRVPLLKGLENDNDYVREVQVVLTLMKNIEVYGYMFSAELVDKLMRMEEKAFRSFSKTLVKELKELSGANLRGKVMYPGFPQEVMEKDAVELYFNAILHYWSAAFDAPWYPKSDVERTEDKDVTQLKELVYCSAEQFKQMFFDIIYSNTSLSEFDQSVVEVFLEKNRTYIMLIDYSKVVFKETVALLASIYYKLNENLPLTLKRVEFQNPTEFIRFLALISGCEASLAGNVTFKKFSRPERRAIIEFINNSNWENKTEDIAQRNDAWKMLVRSLHPFENRYNKFEKAQTLLRAVVNDNFQTYEAVLETNYKARQLTILCIALKRKPGVFARNLQRLFRTFPDRVAEILVHFKDVQEEIATPLLLQLYAYYKVDNSVDRVAFPKGKTSKAMEFTSKGHGLTKLASDSLCAGIRSTLITRFKTNVELTDMGKVYITPEVVDLRVPASQRAANESTQAIERGSKIALGDIFSDKETLRFFVHWQNQNDGRVDLDLSGTILDSDFNFQHHVGWNTSYTSDEMTYSGDVTDAEDGAWEYIDVNLSKVKEKDRYLIISLYSYTGQKFSDVPECYAGWLATNSPQSGELYMGDKVAQKITLNSEARSTIVAVLDLQEHKVIWFDTAMTSGSCASAFGQRADHMALVKAVCTDSRPTMYDLFELHALANGTIVNTKEEADTVIGFNGDIDPMDLNVVASKYLA